MGGINDVQMKRKRVPQTPSDQKHDFFLSLFRIYSSLAFSVSLITESTQTYSFGNPLTTVQFLAGQALLGHAF